MKKKKLRNRTANLTPRQWYNLGRAMQGDKSVLIICENDTAVSRIEQSIRRVLAGAYKSAQWGEILMRENNRINIISSLNAPDTLRGPGEWHYVFRV